MNPAICAKLSREAVKKSSSSTSSTAGILLSNRLWANFKTRLAKFPILSANSELFVDWNSFQLNSLSDVSGADNNKWKRAASEL